MQTRPFETPPAFYARTNARAARRATPRALNLAKIAVFALAVLGILACVIAPDRMMVLGPPTPALIGAFAFGIIMILIGLQQRALAAAYHQSAVRAGFWQAGITDAGLTMRGEHAETLFRWSGLTGVQQTPEGLQVMMGRVAHVPIPSTAFADTAAQDAFRKAIMARIGEVRGAT